jgi:predicted nucleotidyltransferase
MWRGERLMFLGARCDDSARNVHQQRSCATSANVNAKEVDLRSPIVEVA